MVPRRRWNEWHRELEGSGFWGKVQPRKHSSRSGDVEREPPLALIVQGRGAEYPPSNTHNGVTRLRHAGQITVRLSAPVRRDDVAISGRQEWRVSRQEEPEMP